METPCWFPFEGHKYGRRKQKDSSVFEFFFIKALILRLRNLSNIYPETRTVKIAKSQKKKKIGNIFSLHESCPGRHLHTASRKSFGNSSVPISQNEEPFRTEHLYRAISRKFVGKSAHDNPERYCMWVVLSSMFFKEVCKNGTRGHGRVCDC